MHRDVVLKRWVSASQHVPLHSTASARAAAAAIDAFHIGRTGEEPSRRRSRDHGSAQQQHSALARRRMSLDNSALDYGQSEGSVAPQPCLRKDLHCPEILCVIMARLKESVALHHVLACSPLEICKWLWPFPKGSVSRPLPRLCNDLHCSVQCQKGPTSGELIVFLPFVQ